MFKIKLTTIYFILSMLLTPVAYINELVKQDEPQKVQVIVTATMYNAVKSQCDNDPLITAGMYKINPHKASNYKWIAMSRDLLKRWGGHFDYGDKVIIKNAGHKDGVYNVVDTMNGRFKNRIDILETKGVKHYKFHDVIVEKIDI